jgi:hypothetical protein
MSMKYKHVKATNVEELDIKVQEMIDLGWEPSGTPYTLGNTLHQCMVTGIHSESMRAEDQGITPNDVATLALLSGIGQRSMRRRW